MDAINFEQATVNVAESQDEYNTLPSAILNEPIGDTDMQAITVVNCFELTDEEVARIVKYKKLWHRTLTFGRPLQPFNIFAVEDYFSGDSWSEEVAANGGTYEHIESIDIKLSFWSRLLSVFTGKVSAKIRARVKTNLHIEEVYVNLKQSHGE